MMKNLHFTCALLILFLASGSTLLGQKTKSADWKTMLMGTWKVDSAVSFTGQRRIKEQDGHNEENNHLSFISESKLAFFDSASISVSDYQLFENPEARLIYMDRNGFFIDQIDDHSMIISVSRRYDSYKENKMRIYLSKSAGPAEISQLTGKWNYHMPDVYDDKPGNNFLFLHKDHTVQINMPGYQDNGTWSLDMNRFILEIKLPNQTLKCRVIEARASSLMLNQPGNEDSIWSFYKADNQADNQSLDPRDSAAYAEMKADSTSAALKADSMMMAMKLDSVTVANKQKEAFFRLWKAEKVLDGDSFVAEKQNVSVLFLKDNQCRITIGNHTKTGTWKFNTTDELIIFNFNGTENLCKYLMQGDENGNPDFSPGRKAETRLTLTFLPPGEKKIMTYIFQGN